MSGRAPGAWTRAALLVSLLGALALRWPAVAGGLQDDDYIQAAMLDGVFWIERGPLDLFWFSGRNAAEQRALTEHGYLPWWTHPEHRVGMMRPFASALLALEHALGLSPQAQHVVGLLCFVACLWAVHRFLASLLPALVAAVATVLYALDEAHGAPTTWLANRSTLISTALAFLALTSYVRARAQAPGQRGPLLRALALLALAFVSGEYAYFVLGYVLAFEMLRADRRAAPSALLVIGLAALVSGASALLDYGIAQSGFYISPFHDPARFTAAAIARLPALLLDLVFGVPARYVESGVALREVLIRRQIVDPLTWFNLPSYRNVAYVLVLPTMWLLHRATRALTDRDGALGALRFLVLGACFALLPAAGALPTARLIGGSAVGLAALFGALLVSVARARPRSALAGALAMAVLAVHGLLPASRALAEAGYATDRSRTARAWALGADVPSELPEGAQVWLTSASDFTTGAHVPWVRQHAGLPLIQSFHLLSGAGRAHDLIRVDDRTIELQVLASDPGHAFTGTLYRPIEAPFHEGDRVELPGFHVRVIATVAGDPVRIRFSADHSLDDPSLILLCPDPSGLRRCPMPPIGSALRLPRAPLPWGDPHMPFAKTLRRL